MASLPDRIRGRGSLTSRQRARLSYVGRRGGNAHVWAACRAAQVVLFVSMAWQGHGSRARIEQRVCVVCVCALMVWRATCVGQ